MHPADEFKAEFIKKVLSSCIHRQQADSCAYWIEYLTQRQFIQLDTARLLLEYVKDKKKEIRNLPERKNVVLPWNAKRARELEEERRSKFKLIKSEETPPLPPSTFCRL